MVKANSSNLLNKSLYSSQKGLSSSLNMFFSIYVHSLRCYICDLKLNGSYQLFKPNQIPQPIQKLGFVFCVNSVLSLIKDDKFVRELRKSKDKKLTSSSLSLLFLRDLIAMASAFTFPPLLGKYISHKTGITQKNGQRIGQLLCPLMIQFVATPIHLLALNLSKEPGWTIRQRTIKIRGLYFNTLIIRMMRFLHSYGLGGIANIELRSFFKSKVPLE